jgi:hypothetical protein
VNAQPRDSYVPPFGRVGITLLLVVSAALCGAFALLQGDRENPLGNMGAVHLAEAEHVLSGDGFGRTTRGGTFHPDLFARPTYTLFLTPFVAVFGRHSAFLRPAVAGAQGLLLGLAALAMASVLARVGCNRAARLAAWGVVVHPVLVSQAATFVDTTLFASAMAAAYASAVALRDDAPARHRILPGALLGFALLTRSTALALVPAVVLASSRAATCRAARLQGAAFLAIGVAAILAPWFVRNHALTDRLMLSTVDGVNLWMGNNANTAAFLDADRSLDELPGRGRYDSSKTVPVADQLERADAARADALRFIREHPQEAASLAWRKAGDLWSPLCVPRSTRSRLSDVKDLVCAAWSIPLFILATAGAWMSIREGGSLRVLAVDVLVTCALFTVPHALAWGGTRLRAPIDPFLVALAAVAVTAAVARFRRRESGPGRTG